MEDTDEEEADEEDTAKLTTVSRAPVRSVLVADAPVRVAVDSPMGRGDDVDDECC